MTKTRADVEWSRDHWLVSQIFLYAKEREENGTIIWGEPFASSTAAASL